MEKSTQMVVAEIITILSRQLTPKQARAAAAELHEKAARPGIYDSDRRFYEGTADGIVTLADEKAAERRQ